MKWTIIYYISKKIIVHLSLLLLAIILFINLLIYIQFFQVLTYRNIDYKFLIFAKNSYKSISKFLNSKYYSTLTAYVKKNHTQTETEELKNKSIHFVDFFPRHSVHREIITSIKKILSSKHNIYSEESNPNFLFFNRFGCKHFDEKYKNSIKIAIYSENVIPDFYYTDYGLGHHHISYFDRYYRFPLYFFKYRKLYNFLQNNFFRNFSINILRKKKFCAAMISNSRKTDKFRLNFIKELNKYKKIDMGGKYMNNVGYIKNKMSFLNSYKFSIAMENTNGNGYCSEKIIESYLSGTIPIYYGNYMIDEYINPKSYILIKGKEDMIEKIKYIIEIDNNNTLYENIFKEKILINSNTLNEKINLEIKDYFLNIFSQELRKAKRLD